MFTVCVIAGCSWISTVTVVRPCQIPAAHGLPFIALKPRTTALLERLRRDAYRVPNPFGIDHRDLAMSRISHAAIIAKKRRILGSGARSSRPGADRRKDLIKLVERALRIRVFTGGSTG